MLENWAEDEVLKEELNKAIREDLEEVTKAHKSIYSYLDYMERVLTTSEDYENYKYYGLDNVISMMRKGIVSAIYDLTYTKRYISRKGISLEEMVEICQRIDRVIFGFIVKYLQTETLEEDLENNKRESAIKLLKGMKREHEDLGQEITGLYELADI